MKRGRKGQGRERRRSEEGVFLEVRKEYFQKRVGKRKERERMKEGGEEGEENSGWCS